MRGAALSFVRLGAGQGHRGAEMAWRWREVKPGRTRKADVGADRTLTATVNQELGLASSRAVRIRQSFTLSDGTPAITFGHPTGGT